MYTPLRALILLIIFSTCVACSSTQKLAESIFASDDDNSEPPSPLTNIIATADLNQVWSENIGKGTDELFIKLTPVIKGEHVFIADTRGEIVALFADSGKNVWDNDSDLPITGGPGADENLVLVGTSEGDVLALISESGEEAWRTKVSSEVLSPPRESDGVVVVRTIDGKIFALDAATGDRLWIYDRTVPNLTLRGTSTPVIANGLVIAGFDGGRLTALELKTGKLIWEAKVAIPRGRSQLERMVDIDSQPLILGDSIYVTTFQANVSALSLDSGQVLWQRDISSHSELSADAEYLYVTDYLGNIWALDRFSGGSIWKQEKLMHRKVTGPAILGDKVIVGDLEGYLHWLDKETGDFAARIEVEEDPILTKPIVANGMLFAYSSGGKLAAYTYKNNEVTGRPNKPVIVEEQPEIKKTTTSYKQPAESEEEESSFFGSFLDIFSGDDEEE
ncbi:MAG: outer membrane protein assembly factor BamB [Gammaproteobacteria bacterium]